MRDEGGDQGVTASPSDAGPACSAPWVGLGVGTHFQKMSMATSPARRMAKRMERMVVMAIMLALCPLPVVEMVLGDLAVERAGGEGAGCRDAQPGAAQGVGMVTVGSCVPTQHAITVPPYTSQTRGTALPQFPQLLTEALTPNHCCSAFSPLGPPHMPKSTPYPPRGLWAGCGDRTSSGTFPEHDWHRPACLSLGHRALQGEELHPEMGGEIVGHGAVGRGLPAALGGPSPGAGSPVGPGAGQGPIAGGSGHILGTARLAAHAQHCDVPGGFGTGVVGQGGVEGHVGTDGVREPLESGLGSPRPRGVAEVGCGCREGMGVRRDLVGVQGPPARSVPWAAPTYPRPGPPPARCRRCRSP